MRVGMALGLLLAGCYAPQPHAGAPCPDGVCPTGLVCSPATMTCETTAIDAGMRDSSIDIDARIDGMPDARIDAPPPNAPVLRQQTTGYLNANTQLSVTLNTAPVAGNVLVMIGSTVSGPITISGGGIATWSLASQSLVNANSEIYFGVTDGSSSTITISRNDTASPIFMHVGEWSGLATSSLLDDAAANDGTTSPASAGSVTTVAPALLVFGAAEFQPGTFGAPTPGTWTALTAVNGTSVIQNEWYRLEPTPGTYSPTVTETEHEWDAALAAFHYVP
jgi:hypothetical protein